MQSVEDDAIGLPIRKFAQQKGEKLVPIAALAECKFSLIFFLLLQAGPERTASEVYSGHTQLLALHPVSPNHIRTLGRTALFRLHLARGRPCNYGLTNQINSARQCEGGFCTVDVSCFPFFFRTAVEDGPSPSRSLFPFLFPQRWVLSRYRYT